MLQPVAGMLIQNSCVCTEVSNCSVIVYWSTASIPSDVSRV